MGFCERKILIQNKISYSANVTQCIYTHIDTVIMVVSAHIPIEVKRTYSILVNHCDSMIIRWFGDPYIYKSDFLPIMCDCILVEVTEGGTYHCRRTYFDFKGHHLFMAMYAENHQNKGMAVWSISSQEWCAVSIWLVGRVGTSHQHALGVISTLDWMSHVFGLGATDRNRQIKTNNME